MTNPTEDNMEQEAREKEYDKLVETFQKKMDWFVNNLPEDGLGRMGSCTGMGCNLAKYVTTLINRKVNEARIDERKLFELLRKGIKESEIDMIHGEYYDDKESGNG